MYEQQHDYEEGKAPALIASIDDDVPKEASPPPPPPPPRCELVCGRPLWCRLITWKIVLFFLMLLLAAIITSAVMLKIPVAEVPPLRFAKNSQSDFTDKIVIIGAGAAGLYAGYTLKFLGVENFVILEASSVIGGRVAQMDDFIDLPLDIGAEWIHVDPRILKDLLLPFDGTAGLVNELPATIDYHPSSFSSEYGECCGWIRFYYREHKFRDSSWWAYFDKFIRSQIDEHIQLNSVVETVDWTSADEITIRLANGTTYTADKVLMAVPGAILQNADISFDPPLPKRRVAALDKVWFAPGLKVWIEFEERFYQDLVIPGPGLDFARYDELYFDAVYKKPTNRHVLCYFNVGDEAPNVVKLSDEEILKKILTELDEIYDGKATKYFIQYRVQNWFKEPYIQSAYSYNYDEFWDDIGIMQQSIDKRIFFAGEHLYKDNVGISTVHGAALTGRRAAEQMIAAGQ